MKIGYACLTVGVNHGGFKTCNQKNATVEKLEELMEHNLQTLDEILEYNIKNQIKMFRISSDIIPFGSSDINTLDWRELFSEKLKEIGHKIKENGMRVSMHPGQYTVLNSPNVEVVHRAVLDLSYHTAFLDSLGISKKHKIILHIGGVYGNKQEAIQRFLKEYHKLNKQVKDRLVIENDQKLYTIEEVLEIGNKGNIPVIFDNLHHALNPSMSQKQEIEWIKEARKTWFDSDGNQKIHYSQQNPNKKPGAHSETINGIKFFQFYQMLVHSLPFDNIPDIMLEVKDKNLSAIKCLLLVSENSKMIQLEREWALYKYKVLEKSQNDYKEIRRILKDKTKMPILEFYQKIEEALQLTEEKGSVVNTAQHIWGYFKKNSTSKEKEQFLSLLERYGKNEIKSQSIRNYLWKLTLKYQDTYLLDSYYFKF